MDEIVVKTITTSSGKKLPCTKQVYTKEELIDFAINELKYRPDKAKSWANGWLIGSRKK